MNNEEIEHYLLKSLQEMAQLVNDGTCKSHIIMPRYRATVDNTDTIRYSEQELKQLFLSFISRNEDYYYSVETPSKYVYSFADKSQPVIKELKEDDDHCESARFDVSLYSSNRTEDLITHIEFKHENTQEINISKDLLKLTNELCECKISKTYFVHYIVRQSNKWKTSTLSSVIKKYRSAISFENHKKTSFKGVWVYLMFIKLKDIQNSTKQESFIYKFNLNSLEELKENPKNEEILEWIRNKEIWKR